MRRILMVTFPCFLVLFACKKSAQVPASYIGRWQWISSSFGPRTTTPAADSAVILNLETGNQYQATLNGQIVTAGSFQLNSSSNGPVLQFNNINQPVGNHTSGSTGSGYFIAFNFLQIGQLTLFQYNSTSTPHDTLTLVRSPITPGATVSVFKRM
jgi:hypothetical protein